MKKRMKALLSVLFLAALLVNIVPVYAGATEATATVAPTDTATDATTTEATATIAPTEAAPAEVTYSGEYGAYMGIQTNTSLWIFRNAYDDKTYGVGTPEFGQLSSVKAGVVTKYDGTFTDAVVDGDGTYTVTLENPDFMDEERLSLLFVSTNIPISDKIKVTDVQCKFDGSTKFTFDEAYLDPESKEFVKILCLNDWNVDVKDKFFYPFPPKKVELTFTITGMGYESQLQAAEPTVTPTTAPATDNTTDTTTDTTDDAATNAEDTGSNMGLIIGIIAAVVVVAVVAFVLVSKKKK